MGGSERICDRATGAAFMEVEIGAEARRRRASSSQRAAGSQASSKMQQTVYKFFLKTRCNRLKFRNKRVTIAVATVGRRGHGEAS